MMSYVARIRWATRAMTVCGFAWLAAAMFAGNGGWTYVLSVLCLISLAAQVAARYSFLRYQVADLQRQVGALAAELYRRP